MTVFGIVSLVLAVWGNLGHLLFTVWVSAEQLKTGWGYGTDMEMAVLMPWLVEVLCIPAFIIGAAFLVQLLKNRYPGCFAAGAWGCILCFYFRLF